MTFHLARTAAASLAAMLMCGASGTALGQDRDAEMSALRAEIARLAERLDSLEKTKPAPAAATASLPNGKPAFASADGRFTANIRAIVMMDAGHHFQDDNLPAATVGRDLADGVNFRRARIGFDGKLFKDFDYALVYEFGGSGAEEAGRLYEASVTYTALKPWRIKAGAFEPNIGLAAATSTSAMPLMERPAPAEVARGVAAGDSRVALQVTRTGTFGDAESIGARWLVSGALTGPVISASAFEEQSAVVGRLAAAPFSTDRWQAHFGANAQYVIQPNDATGGPGTRYPIQLRDRPELRLDGARLIDTGAIDAEHATVLGLEAAFQSGRVLIESEAFRYDIERRAQGALPDPRFDGWYVQGVLSLTGEPRLYDAAEGRFGAPKGKTVFDPANRTYGAFELAARYSHLNLDFNEGQAGQPLPAGGVRGGEQTVIGVGLNWHLNPALRMMLDYQRVEIDRLNTAGVQVGQEYDAIAGRAQLTF